MWTPRALDTCHDATLTLQSTSRSRHGCAKALCCKSYIKFIFETFTLAAFIARRRVMSRRCASMRVRARHDIDKHLNPGPEDARMHCSTNAQYSLHQAFHRPPAMLALRLPPDKLPPKPMPARLLPPPLLLPDFLPGGSNVSASAHATENSCSCCRSIASAMSCFSCCLFGRSSSLGGGGKGLSFEAVSAKSPAAQHHTGRTFYHDVLLTGGCPGGWE